MAPGHYIREWRKFRGMTMVELAERVDMSHAVLSRLERGQQRYNQVLLEQIAVALRTTPADLIMRDPGNNDEFWGVAADLSPAERRQAVDLMNVLRKARGAGNDD